MTIRNPILPGFNPDPSIVRVGDDYFIATSTFEWYPGVQIHHSRDLVHWRLVSRPLARPDQLDLRGAENSGGVWAPDLSYADGKFWLVYSNLATLNGAVKDSPNYVATAPSIEGPWSAGTFLGAAGFDASLFHDDDGRKYLLNMLYDHRPGHHAFAGIRLREMDPATLKLIGEAKTIFLGTEWGVTEGPHLYKRDGWYYLLVAEGGTKYEHQAVFARSRTIDGRYEVDPEGPILTAWGAPANELQKAGHASLVDTPDGEYYLAHLVGRPLTVRGRCPLGRETAIQKVTWPTGGFPRLAHGSTVPLTEVPAPNVAPCPWPEEPSRMEFDSPEMPAALQSPRIPIETSWTSLTDRPGYLRLRGRQFLESRFDVSHVARRVEAFRVDVTTSVEFHPTIFQHMAGLTAYYHTGQWIFLHVTHDERLGKCLRLGIMDDEVYTEAIEPIPLGPGAVELRAAIDYDAIQFAFRQNGDWQLVGDVQDFSTLSDDYTWAKGMRFTGAFVGLACLDLHDYAKVADFDYFDVRNLTN